MSGKSKLIQQVFTKMEKTLEEKWESYDHILEKLVEEQPIQVRYYCTINPLLIFLLQIC